MTMTSPSSAASGMSKREFFASKAIVAVLTNGDYSFDYAARQAVYIADSLIEALNETSTPDQCRAPNAK